MESRVLFYPEKKERKQKILTVLLIIALIVILILLMIQCQGEPAYSGPSRTAVIEKNETEELTEPDSRSTRIVISPSVRIINETMQDLYFCNYNKERLLRCRIKVGEEYVYDSGMLEEGKELIGDFIKTDALMAGDNEALAEIYSYDLEENPIGQTNVNLILHWKP